MRTASRCFRSARIIVAHSTERCPAHAIRKRRSVRAQRRIGHLADEQRPIRADLGSCSARSGSQFVQRPGIHDQIGRGEIDRGPVYEPHLNHVLVPGCESASDRDPTPVLHRCLVRNRDPNRRRSGPQPAGKQRANHRGLFQIGVGSHFGADLHSCSNGRTLTR